MLDGCAASSSEHPALPWLCNKCNLVVVYAHSASCLVIFLEVHLLH